MTTDKIEIEILADGTIKTSTDKISMASHGNAENFLKEIFRLSGGKSKLGFKQGHARLGTGESHSHGHGHSHTH